MVAGQITLFADMCEKCGLRLKHHDIEGVRKWCSRCMAIYRRQQWKKERVEHVIVEGVGEKYIRAALQDLGKTSSQILALRPDEDVYFCGPTGTGKTYAMAAMFRYYTEQGFECRRINFDDFCVQYRAAMSESALKEDDFRRKFIDADKLFIDDLGLRSKQESDFAYVTLFTIINKRQEQMLPTIISSNKTIEEIGRVFDSRIASRLQSAAKIILEGQDRRLQK